MVLIRFIFHLTTSNQIKQNRTSNRTNLLPPINNSFLFNLFYCYGRQQGRRVTQETGEGRGEEQPSNYPIHIQYSFRYIVSWGVFHIMYIIMNHEWKLR